MNELFDDTDDIALELDEIPTYDSKTSGIASASQLVNDTNDIDLTPDYTA